MSTTATPKPCGGCGQPVIAKSPSGQGWTDPQGKTTCTTPGTTHRPAP